MCKYCRKENRESIEKSTYKEIRLDDNNDLEVEIEDCYGNYEYAYIVCDFCLKCGRKLKIEKEC